MVCNASRGARSPCTNKTRAKSSARPEPLLLGSKLGTLRILCLCILYPRTGDFDPFFSVDWSDCNDTAPAPRLQASTPKRSIRGDWPPDGFAGARQKGEPGRALFAPLVLSPRQDN